MENSVRSMSVIVLVIAAMGAMQGCSANYMQPKTSPKSAMLEDIKPVAILGGMQPTAIFEEPRFMAGTEKHRISAMLEDIQKPGLIIDKQIQKDQKPAPMPMEPKP